MYKRVANKKQVAFALLVYERSKQDILRVIITLPNQKISQRWAVNVS